MINGVVLEKLRTLDSVLGELRSLGEISVQQLEEDWRTRRAVERDLQILVEVVIDVCQRMLAVLGHTPTTTGAEAVARCIELGVITEYATYRLMVQFRIFVVHRYEYVDTAILADMVNRRLPDFERFHREVLAYVSRELGTDCGYGRAPPNRGGGRGL